MPKPGFRSADRAGVPLAAVRDRERSPAETGRADVAKTENSVAPAAVGILVSLEPFQSSGNDATEPVCTPGFQRQRRDSDCGGKGTRCQPAFPVPRSGAAVEKARDEILNGFV